MTSNDTHQQLMELFHQAKQAHFQAHIDTDGADSEWPLWYADYLLEPLSRILQVDMTKSELVYLLVKVDREQRESAPQADWTDYYAAFCLQNFPQAAQKEK